MVNDVAPANPTHVIRKTIDAIVIKRNMFFVFISHQSIAGGVCPVHISYNPHAITSQIGVWIASAIGAGIPHAIRNGIIVINESATVPRMLISVVNMKYAVNGFNGAFPIVPVKSVTCASLIPLLPDSGETTGYNPSEFIAPVTAPNTTKHSMIL
jgi:hypothetical protein